MVLNYLSPKERRYVSDLAGLMHERRVALFLGAGADQALCRGMPSWNDLVRSLFGYNRVQLPDSFIAENLQTLPTVARHRLGEVDFAAKIHDTFRNPQKKPAAEVQSFCDALRSLAPYIPLVVTTNYSNAAYLALGDNRPLVELNTLKSVHMPDPGSTRTLFIHLHGRTQAPVLDANGYRSAEYGEVLYYEFLRNLITKWTVLFCGVSFSDPPLRSAAAQVKQRYPEIGHRHFLIERKASADTSKLMLECCSECNEISRKPTAQALLEQLHECSDGCEKLELKQHVAMGGLHPRLVTLGRSLSYDVQTIQIKQHSDLPEIWKAMEPMGGNGKVFLPGEDQKVVVKFIRTVIKRKDLTTLADFLDHSGDYESMSQRVLSYAATDQQLSQLVNIFKEKTKNISVPSEFETLLRVERHLRHILYLASGNLSKHRISIWNMLLEKWNANPNLLDPEKYDKLDILADFYYGLYEVSNAPIRPSEVLNKLKNRLSNTEPFDARIRIAEKVWLKPDDTNEQEFQNLRSMAFDAGWESIEAKCCVDIVRSRILNLKKTHIPSPTSLAKKIDAVQALCSQAKHSAKAAGTMRRYISALLYSALWMPDTKEAVAIVRAAAELCMQNGKRMVENKIWDGVRFVWWVLNDSEDDELSVIDPHAKLADFEQGQRRFWESYFCPYY